MTIAPQDLKDIQLYLHAKTGLAWASLGIVGDPDHAASGGYHEGNDDLARVGRLNTDYSKRESPRDRPGTVDASALDIGDFTRNGITLRSMTLKLVADCHAGDPRLRDIREVIYTPDGVNVRRYDALGLRSSGDSSHLYHTHLSFFRDSLGRRANLTNILGWFVEHFEGKRSVKMQPVLIKDSTGVVWVCDGIHRRRVLSGEQPNQSFSDDLLGRLGAKGVVQEFGTPPTAMDVWGVDVSTGTKVDIDYIKLAKAIIAELKG